MSSDAQLTPAAGPPGWHNPLRDKRDKRMPRIAGPCSVVIFGVTGDLSRKKLIPAIYDLANRGLLPPSFALVGFARRDWVDEDFGKIVYEAVKKHARTPFRQEVWDRLADGIRFVQGSFDDDASFHRLAEALEKLDIERGTGCDDESFTGDEHPPVAARNLSRDCRGIVGYSCARRTR